MSSQLLYTAEEELDAHLAAMQWFESRRIAGHELFTHQDLMEGMMWHGHRIALTHQTQGIWRPQGFDAAFTFKTVARSPNKEAPYEDRIDADGLLRYKFADSPSKNWTNDAMINAAQQNYPLAWLIGVRPGNILYYYARFPVYIERVDHRRREFIVSIHETVLGHTGISNQEPPMIERKYVSRWTRARVHQHDFREHVISAYDISCAICDLPHAQLLEAAHIIPDSENSGIPEVSNGLALCRTHHTAYDRNLIGIDPDHRIHVAERARKLEKDTRRISLTPFNRRALSHVPKNKKLHPDQGRLHSRFINFLEIERTVNN